MRWVTPCCIGLLLVLVAAGCKTQSANIAKVLPHYLDQEGRHTQAASLFERDAYQAHLRANPDEVGGLRFDVHWSSTVYYLSGMRLKLELRGSRNPEVMTFEQEVEKRPWYQRWTSIELAREDVDRLGEVVAWRVSLWDGDKELAERQSFLW